MVHTKERFHHITLKQDHMFVSLQDKLPTLGYKKSVTFQEKGSFQI